MPSPRVVDLYVANSITELDNKFEVSSLKNNSCLQLCKTAAKLFQQADLKRLDGDEENAYIFYMRFLSLITKIQTAKEYEKHKGIVTKHVTKTDVNNALNYAEILKESLKKRYEDKRQFEKLSEFENQNIVRQKIDTDREKARKNLQYATQKSFSFPEEDDKNLSVRNLYKLMEKKNRIMMIDTRPEDDYKKSHIIHKLCVSIPQEKIIHGYTPDKMVKNLSSNIMDVWNQRKYMELLVVFDWSSKVAMPGTSLAIFMNALQKWDLAVKDSKRKPIVLDGGYEAWLSAYPTITTNPHVIPPDPNVTLDDLLKDIDYPSLLDTPTENKPMGLPSISSSGNNPTVDRSKKAAAVATYDKRAIEMVTLMDHNEKLTNHSYTIEKERVEAEQNWEKINLSHEKEGESVKKEALGLKKDELFSLLLQLESRQNDTVLEISQVKDQLDKLKKEEKAVRGITSEASSSDDSVGVLEEAKKAVKEALEKEGIIKEIEDQKAAVESERTMLQMERERKLKDEKEKKKLMYRHIEDDVESAPLKVENDGTDLIRSYSSPNIQQMPDEISMKPQIPTFDRNAKPRYNSVLPPKYIQRDFQGVFGNVDPGLTGLKNLGNTCYMNSIMQCLSNTSALSLYFCGDTYRNDVEDALVYNTGTRGAVAEEVAAVVKALWSGEFKFISAKDLRNVIGKHRAMFRGFEQQDSHEFLTILMDWLHNDLQKPTRSHLQMETLPAAEKAWLQYTKSMESFILKLFYGQIKSTLTCLKCGDQSITHDSFSNLSLELPTHANKCTLNDCLQLYLKEERISEWQCPSCKQKRDAVKKLDISKLPPILIIHFKRFCLDPKDCFGNSYMKKLTSINFPLVDLNMDRFSTESCRNRRNTTYNLYGVSNHYGSMEGGHYTAYCKRRAFSKWYKFDDHVVTEISSSDVKSSAAYILFYSALPES